MNLYIEYKFQNVLFSIVQIKIRKALNRFDYKITII